MSSGSWLKVGQIVSTFGLKGQVKVNLLTDFSSRFAVGSRLRLNGDWIEIESLSEHRAQLILKLSGIDSIEAAELLRDAYLEVAEDEKPKLEKDEYFTSDLVGLEAVTPEGEVLGVVDDVVAAPAHDLLVIGEIVVPAVKAFVRKVDIKAKIIVVQLIPGMRPGDDED